MSVEKRKDGTGYDVRWRDSAGKQRKRKVTLWRDAVSLDGEMKRKKAMGELIVHEKGNIKLNDFWEVWWTNYATPNLGARTLATYAQLWKKHVSPRLGKLCLSSLNAEQVASLSADLSSRLSSASTRKCLAILQGVLERAVEWQYIASNPAKGIRKPKLVQRRGRALTFDQLGALCSELDTRSRLFVEVLAWTGMRPGELRTRRWEHLSRELIYVEATKTDTIRSVDLRPEARKALLEWYMACGQPAGFDRIFGQVDSIMDEWSANAYRLWQRKVFTPAAERAGLKGLVPYDLRHTAASRLIAEGKDVLYVARQLGHAPEITLKTYAHEFEQQRKSVPSECLVNLDIARILRADGEI